MTVYEILSAINSVSGRNDKMAILEANKNNGVLKKFFKMALDPMITYGIKNIPAYDKNSKKPMYALQQSLEELERLVTREFTGNAAIEFLSDLLERSDPEDAFCIVACIEKDAKCGLAESSVNKVWPGWIHTFELMKANPYDEKTIANIRYPARSDLKLDGARCNLLFQDHKFVAAFSSSGREIETHGCFDAYGDLFDNVVLDGELLAMDPSGDFMDRKTGNGIVNRAIKGTIPVEQAKLLHFVAFDAITIDTWKNGVKSAPYSERLEYLEKKSPMFLQNMSLVESKIVHSEAEAVHHFNTLKNRGEEGTILKNIDAVWEGKRSKNQIKFKGIISCDLKVVGVVEGTGKFLGKMGALVCESADGEVSVNVGSGFTDADRELPFDFWDDKIIEVLYNERIRNKTEGSKWSLFLPRFARVRIDKDVADTIDNIPLK